MSTRSLHVFRCRIHCTSPPVPPPSLSFFFQDPPSTDIYTLSLHDALPISPSPPGKNEDAAPHDLLAPAHPLSDSCSRPARACAQGGGPELPRPPGARRRRLSGRRLGRHLRASRRPVSRRSRVPAGRGMSGP